MEETLILGLGIFIIILFFIFILKNISKRSNQKFNEEENFYKDSWGEESYSESIGKFGEEQVSSLLEDLPNDYKIFNDIYIYLKDKTVQIDHIIISRYGIFVIETKNYSGWIYGGENKEYWTENLYGKKYRFYNPLKQNYSHKKALENILRINGKDIIPVVVFVGNAKFINDIKGNIVYLYELENFIKRYNEPIFDDFTVQRLIKRLNMSIITDERIKRIHIKNVQERVDNKKRSLQQGICPKCGGKLVERQSKYGTFIGCSNYPRCKFILRDY